MLKPKPYANCCAAFYLLLTDLEIERCLHVHRYAR